MLDFLKSLSELGSLQRLPWRWWLCLIVGLGVMIAILMHVQGDIAVLYVFINLVLTVLVAAAWQWRADRKSPRNGRRP
jgi:hypothetical protein